MSTQTQGSPFSTAMNTKDTYTENMMPTHSTSGSGLVDMFFSMGAYRGRSEEDIENLFMKAFSGSYKHDALRALFYNRDIRGGQGERHFFRVAFKALCNKYPDIAKKNLHLIPEYGRWDDVLHATVDTPVEEAGLELYSEALKEKNGLAGKWAPREGKSDHRLYVKLRDHIGASPKFYRKLVVELTNVVENKMCENDWGSIEYSSVPSVAMNRYRNAFKEHDEQGFMSFLDDVEDEDNEKVTINASALFPHDIVHKLYGSGWSYSARNVSNSERRTLEAQWEALPDWMPKGRKVLPVCDVSGSMLDEKISDSVTAMDVSIALGLYISERNEGEFQDQVMTFSKKPTFTHLKSEKLSDRISELSDINWNMNTNLELMFKTVLQRAQASNLAQEDMPSAIIILSDMQFDRCMSQPSDSAMEMIEREYAQAGYEVPQIIFWNLASRDDAPVKFNKRGVALVSGFSPSILKQVLSGEDLNPLSIVQKVTRSERYEPVSL